MTKVVPKKSLGQHWLYDETSLLTMCEAAQVDAADTVLEVGPGLGTLTHHLLSYKARVVAVEYDRILAEKLKKHYLNHPRFVVHNEDILNFDFTSLPEDYKIVANIPYYLTSLLLRTITEASRRFSVAVLLVQKEVAERVCAKPGNMSILAVSVQLYSEPSLERVVLAELFTPPPKVDSQILVLKKRPQPLFTVDEKKFMKIVKAGFSLKRKKLKTSLAYGLSISKQQAEEFLVKADISPDERAQQLRLDDWYALYKVLY